MGEKHEDSNLASEYLVMSLLFRAGFRPSITLGNKKAVDIIIEDNKGGIKTIDVKGLKGTTGFPIGQKHIVRPGHYYIFVSFLNKFKNPFSISEVYVVPSVRIKDLLYLSPNKEWVEVSLSKLRSTKRQFYYKWDNLNDNIAIPVYEEPIQRFLDGHGELSLRPEGGAFTLWEAIIHFKRKDYPLKIDGYELSKDLLIKYASYALMRDGGLKLAINWVGKKKANKIVKECGVEGLTQ